MSEIQNQIQDTGERVIDLRSLFFFLLKRWRSLLLFLAIGLLAGFGYACWQKVRTQFDPNSEKNRPLLEEIERKYRQLGLRAEERSHEYRVYLDRNTQYTYATVRYYLDSDNDRTTLALGELLDVTREDGYLDDLWEILDPESLPGVTAETEISRASVGAVLNRSFSSHGDPESVVLLADSGITTSAVYGTIVYSIHYVTEAQREAIIRYVDEAMTARSAELVASYGTFRLECFSVFRDNESASTTFARANEVEAAAFTDRSEFYAWLVELSKMKDTGYDNAGVVQYFRETVLGESRNISRAKYTLLGAVIGAVIWGVWGIIRYFAGGKIRCASELAGRYGLPSLGCVQSKTKKRSTVDRLIRKWEAAGSCTEEYAASSAALLGRPILLCETGRGKETKARSERLASLSGAAAGDIRENSSLIASAADNAGAVLFVELGVSKMRKAAETIEICQLHKIPILGALYYEDR